MFYCIGDKLIESLQRLFSHVLTLPSNLFKNIHSTLALSTLFDSALCDFTQAHAEQGFVDFIAWCLLHTSDSFTSVKVTVVGLLVTEVKEVVVVPFSLLFLEI